MGKGNPYAGEKKPSMLRRDDSHDYSSRCFYMVTLTVEGRRQLLGMLAGRSDAAACSPDAPHIQLSALGQAVNQAWAHTSTVYPQVAVIAQQVMPDHFHGILYFREKTELTLEQVIRGFKAACNKAYRQLILGIGPEEAAARPQPTGKTQEETKAQQPTGKAQPASDSPSSYAATVSRPSSAGLLWSHGYNDRILHSYHQLDRWKAYLRDNPRRLLMRREHPDLFCVVHNLHFAGLTFTAQGNRFLLDAPLKLQVQCSRSITETELEAKKSALLVAAANNGAVLVSPAISPGEKAIMHAAFEAGLPLIYLQENAPTKYGKPGGAFFDACSDGRLLLLSPWEHHNEQQIIRRDQCLTLNDMTHSICEQ